MKAIRITSDTRDRLKEYSDINMNYDGIVTRLINDVEDYMPLPYADNLKYFNINLHEDTIEKLKAFGLTNGESYENILIRMLLLAEDLNNTK